MASRLSGLSIKSTYDKGHTGLPWTLPKPGVNLLKVDFDRILASADPEVMVQSLPPQVVYHSIKMAGLEQSAEIIGLLSKDQFMRLLDYDVWKQDILNNHEAFKWLLALRNQGPLAIARRFKGLDEEYQIAILDRRIRVYDLEEYESMSDQAKADLISVPGGEFYYDILAETPDEQEAIHEIIQSAFALDVGYALTLLTHVAYMPPHETEYTLSQFRNSRLEEDGFIRFEESMQAFAPIDVEQLKHRWQLASRESIQSVSLSPLAATFSTFIEDVVYHGVEADRWSDEDGIRFQQGSLYLANSLCVATHVEPADVESLNQLLEQSKALMGLGLESISGGDRGRALSCLKNEYPKLLLRAGLTLIYAYQRQVMQRLEAMLPDELHTKLSKMVTLQKWGEAQWLLDVSVRDLLGFQATEALKGLFNRFPMRPIMKVVDGTETIYFAPIGSVKDFSELQQKIAVLLTDALTRN